MPTPLHLIQLTDTHIGPSDDYVFGDAVVTLPRVRRVIDAINALPFDPDLVVHSGDIAHDPEPAAFERAAEEMARLRWPVHYVAGNHDSAPLIKEYLPRPDGITPLVEDGDRLAYWRDVGGHRIIVLDACVPGSTEGIGQLPANQMAALADVAGPDACESFVIFLHFAALPVGSPWIDGGMVMENGEALHRQLVALGGAERCRGVFYGHIHHPVQNRRDGILYSAAGSACCQIAMGPEDEKPRFLGDAPAYFDHITIDGAETVVESVAVM